MNVSMFTCMHVFMHGPVNALKFTFASDMIVLLLLYLLFVPVGPCVGVKTV